MVFARKVWAILVGIKDAFALLFLLLFFFALYAVLTYRPNPGLVREGALLLKLDGTVVEEPSEIDPLQLLLAQSAPAKEFRERDLVRAIESAAADDRIKAVVLDLDKFAGGGQVHLERIGAALDTVRAAKKPILTHAIAYGDDAMLLAAHASEVWAEPLGGAIVVGPGGNRLYYKQLIDNLKVKAHVFKVGTYKSAVEPYIRSDGSPEAEAALAAVYAALWESYRTDVAKARPKANLDLVTKDPVGWLAAANGETGQAALQAGLVDKLGDRTAFGQRVAALVGEEPGGEPGTYKSTELEPWLADLGDEDDDGKAIGVVTIAGEIVDGDAGPGSAGGDRIAKVLDEALDDDLAALVVRVDSPGGSVLASERIRTAILRHKAKNIPVVVSMGNLAASGGYWVSTPATRIFAEPGTITGSIGIFGVIPTFESTLADWGVTSDGVRTTPLSGQPDILGGLTPEVEQLVQANIEAGYRRFIGLVGQSRNKTPEQVDAIGQGRIWDGGTARQLGLVDQLGGLEDALAYAAKAAKLGEGEWHAEYLGDEDDALRSILVNMLSDDDDAETAQGGFIGLAAARQSALAARLSHDLGLLMGRGGVQAYCLECPVTAAARPLARGETGLLRALGDLLDLAGKRGG